MDKYLNREESYQRLLFEYRKYNSLIVAVDFDDTIYNFHGTENSSYEMVRQLVRDLHEANCFIVIWTGNQDIDFIKFFLAENNIPYNSINEEAPVSKRLLGDKLPRKVYANVYIDDRGGMAQVYEDLVRLLKEIKNGN